MMMRPNRGTRRTPRVVRTEGARKLIFAARAETDCCIVSQSTSSAYKILSLTPAKAWTRMSDLTYRFGGAEFVVVADDINADDALTLGERMRRRIADSHAGETSGVTISIGIASCARDATDYDTLFELPTSVFTRRSGGS